MAAIEFMVAEEQAFGAGSLISVRGSTRHKISSFSHSAESWRGGSAVAAVKGARGKVFTFNGAVVGKDLSCAHHRAAPLAAIKQVCLQVEPLSWKVKMRDEGRRTTGAREYMAAPVFLSTLLEKESDFRNIHEAALVREEERAQRHKRARRRGKHRNVVADREPR